MKQIYKKKILFLVSAILCVSSALGQISNRYQNYSVRHKYPNKWYTIRNNSGKSQASKDMDTFDDETPSFKNTYTNTDIQAAHTYIDTLYVRKGESVTLYLPLISSGQNKLSAQAYQRWYNFITEGTFSYTSRNTTYDIVSFNSTAYRFANGYVGGVNTGLGNNGTNYLDRITFTYPTDAQYNTRVQNGFKNGSAGNKYYIVACDASGYTDFTQSFSSGNGGSFRNGGYIEPTLSARAIYYIIGVDGRGGADETEMWKNGYGRLASSEYQGGDGEGKKFLEEYNITFPCDHLGNQTDELVALSKDARGYRINGDSNDNLNVSISSPNNVFRLLTGGNNNSDSGGSETNSITLTGRRRTITFRKTGAGVRKPWSVADGQTATIIVTKNVGGTTYNIAKFNLTFEKDNRLLTQHQLDRIDRQRKGESTGVTGESWYRTAYQNRTPEFLRENYTLLTSRTLDYDPDVANLYGQNWYYPFPVEWGYSSYAFFDGSTTDDFNGSTDGNTAYNKEPFAEWGYYALTNTYVGYGDKVSNGVKAPTNPSMGGKNADGFFIYVDASDRPGMVMTLPFQENLCRGTKLMVSAWVKSADENSDDSENSAMLFTIYGVDANGKKTPLCSQSTGQITTTTYLTNSDGDEYTNANGYGSSQNDWYQLYFSFVNNTEFNADFVSYELKVDNNCGSTAGGDFYLDEIEVFIAQPTATVTQKDYTCSGERTLLSATLDWAQLCDRVGLDPDETDTGKSPSGIDFCFIDEAEYNRLLSNTQNPTVEEVAKAIKGSIAMIGAGEDAGYNREIASLHYKPVFTENTEYIPSEENLALKNTDGTNYYFYRAGTADEENRRLAVDFYSEMSPNRAYLMLIRDNDGTVSTIEDFAQEMNDPCAIHSRFFVTSQTIIKINGEVANPQTDFCVGQAFNFSAQMRVPDLNDDGTIKRDPETGEEIYTVLDSEVFFDWFFGSEAEFVADHGGFSLETALHDLRNIEKYRDVETLDGVVPATEGQISLTQDEIDLIKQYVDTPAPDGGLNNKLVLHKSSLDITVLETGLELTISPIPAIRPSDSDITDTEWEKICWGYVPLNLTASGAAPKLHAGFNSVEYPSNDFNPSLRIGLAQLKNAAKGVGSLKVNLRGATYTDEEHVERLGLIENLGGDIDYTQIYLISTDDPQYSDLMNPLNGFTQYYLPIGKIISLEAHKYSTTTPYTNEADIEFYFDRQTLVDGKTFTFNPREGYVYTFAIHFAEHGETVNNSCWGSFPLTLKVVPENLVWKGTGATSNWNNDANWKRADAKDLKNTDGTYTDNAENTTDKGFVPMLFSNVIMPKDSKAELYIAGFGDGGNGWVNTSRPDYMELPTENIQYDLMAYEKDGALTTQRYRVNICRDIHFELGAQMLHAEQLLYNKAWTDVEVTPGQWTAVSTPLQGVVAGDWYAPTTGRQETEYFKDIKFNTTDYSRLNPAVYQRSWSTGANIVENLQGTNTPVSFTTEWSSAYNDASVPYVAGGGFSIKGVTSNSSLLFRFPKADTSYDVSTGTLNRDNAGKLLVSNMVDRSDPYTYVHSDKVTVTLTPSADGKYLMVGNPFMASLDVQAFVAANSDVLAQKYWYNSDVTSTAVTYDADTKTWSEGKYLAVPYSVFYVEAADPATATDGVTVTFMADMQEMGASNLPIPAPASLKITAEDAEGSSSAAVRYAASASNGFGMEDAQMISGLTGNADNAPKVYTAAGNTAVSVNQLKDAQRIPLGVTAADGSVVTLTFSGVAAVKDAAIYDAELQSETPLYEGYQLTVNGPSYGRYFLIGHGSGTTGITETGAEGNVSVSSIVPRQVVVTSDTALRSVSVWSAGGALLKKVSPNGNFTCTLNGVDSGMVVVRTETESGSQVTKIRVR
ncbi:hypothetical protein [uncultured Prevotella sp.]|uniref:hypothetical protein n=1 Tax=uncultured Prevotella sp. TaxID=159272 RepID=UPI00265D2ED1|nr:hypothetical protein [uncultured Prevotella sp.]